jgi:CO/xanthine dehydrogenase Mo-binding subunit
MFFPGRPVRLANNRYEQFQSGIKRHAFSMHTRMGVDRETGNIFAFAADHVLHAGGLANFSPTVAPVAANAAPRSRCTRAPSLLARCAAMAPCRR